MTSRILCLWMISAASLLADDPCGTERVDIKLLRDQGASQIASAAVKSTVASLAGFPVPPGLKKGNLISETTRLSNVEKTVYTVDADLVGYVSETDLDIHMVLKDQSGQTMIAEMPFYSCTTQSMAYKQQMINARRVFTSRFPATNSGSYKNLSQPSRVRVTGVGFFDYIHGQNGVAGNGIELHPVIGFSFLDQCTPTDPTQSPLSLSSVNGLDTTPWPPEQRQKPVTQLNSLQDTARLVFAGYKIDPIFISKVQGSNTYVVTIAGVQMDKIQLALNDAKNAGNAGDAANRVIPMLQQVLQLDDTYLKLVRAAIEGFPVPAGANIVLVGHSFGGMVAQKMMVLADHAFQTRWHGSTITLGSPLKFAISTGSTVTRYVLRDSRNDDAVVAFSQNNISIAMVLGIPPGFLAAQFMTFVTVQNGPPDPFGLGLHFYYPNAPELAGYPPLGRAYGQTVQLDTQNQAWCGSGAQFLTTSGRRRKLP